MLVYFDVFFCLFLAWFQLRGLRLFAFLCVLFFLFVLARFMFVLFWRDYIWFVFGLLCFGAVYDRFVLACLVYSRALAFTSLYARSTCP